MAKVDSKRAKDVLDQIGGLEKAIQTAGESARAKLQDIKVDDVRQGVPKTPAGEFDTAGWDGFSEEQQNKLFQRLLQVRDSLHLAAELDGPTDPTHIMYGEYASNTAIIAWASVGFLLTGLLLGAIVWHWERATGTDFAVKIQTAAVAVRDLDDVAAKVTEAKAKVADAQRKVDEAAEAAKKEAQKDLEAQKDQEKARSAERALAERKANEVAVEAIRLIRRGGASEGAILGMVILLGALGGSLHLVGSLVTYVGNRQLKRSWLLYYLSIPIAGAALAPIIYMMLRIGLLSPTGAATDGSNVANLNLIAIYAFAALTGLFGKTASDKLAEVFKTIFRSGEAPKKDPIGSEKPPGAPASG